MKEVDFHYNDNDTLRMEEEIAIIKIHQLAFNCGIIIDQVELYILTCVIYHDSKNAYSKFKPYLLESFEGLEIVDTLLKLNRK